MGTINALWVGVADFVDPTSNSIAELFDFVNFRNFKDYLFVDVDSLYALQVIPESNKNNKLTSKTQKNSLLELLDYTITKEGSKLLKDWVRKPLTNISKIMERQNAIKVLSQPENCEIRHDIKKALKFTKNITSNIKNLQVGKLIWKNWKSTIEFLQTIVSLSKSLRLCFTENTIPDDLSLFLELSVTDFIQLQEFILTYVEPITSEEEGKVKIVNGVDDDLDSMKTQYNNLDNILQEATRLIAQSIPDQVFNTVYIPQLGFLVSREEDISHIDTTFMPDEWQEVFRTSTNVYYKSQEVLYLDEQYGDIYTLISDREIEIVQEILNKVLEFEEPILMMGEASVVLDCYCSLAEVSQLSGYVFPSLTDDYQLEIKQGRHPLVETHLNVFVPNDTDFQINQKITVVTGANSSGKTVYLNQIALVVMMAQIGCAIPAESATIGIVDKILTRVSSRESLEKLQSTFAIDIYQLSKCISLATDRSLIIVDEFGKGSDPIDSNALFGGCLNYFDSMGTSCPRLTNYQT
ncbi:MutS, putative [Candida maltosa Xu316]|uniref:MutS, putative n=1 Tax=Candida maltosa (strain Xu316) TaxID=1245528 RepID=M3JU27_CANMX|nr:MutS, putative [Candida maltosa Xu316]